MCPLKSFTLLQKARTETRLDQKERRVSRASPFSCLALQSKMRCGGDARLYLLRKARQAYRRHVSHYRLKKQRKIG
jgi:hypothetical protein